jgi:hypothetical protein
MGDGVVCVWLHILFLKLFKNFNCITIEGPTRELFECFLFLTVAMRYSPYFLIQTNLSFSKMAQRIDKFRNIEHRSH